MVETEEYMLWKMGGEILQDETALLVVWDELACERSRSREMSWTWEDSVLMVLRVEKELGKATVEL